MEITKHEANIIASLIEEKAIKYAMAAEDKNNKPSERAMAGLESSRFDLIASELRISKVVRVK